MNLSLVTYGGKAASDPVAKIQMSYEIELPFCVLTVFALPSTVEKRRKRTHHEMSKSQTRQIRMENRLTFCDGVRSVIGQLARSVALVPLQWVKV